MTAIPVHTLNSLLPQTQCRECGFSGCLPYAEALVSGEAAANLCTPGGEAVMRDLSALLDRPPLPPVKIHAPALAWIDEAVCIGCTACIRACPVDAIMGASKRMHTVLADECTGCGLCVAPCPVDCIHMQPVADTHLPRARTLSAHADSAAIIAHGDTPRFQAAAHAHARHQAHQRRKAAEQAERERRLTEHRTRRQAATETASAAVPPAAAFNPAALVAQAMARAQAQQSSRTTAANRDSFRETRLQEAQQRAAYRRAMRDLQYGSETEQAAALEWLRRHKAEQEAPNGSQTT